MEIITSLAAGVAVVAFCCAAFSYVILRPLNLAIKALQLSVDKLTAAVNEIEAKRQSMDIRLTRVESSTASAHKRLDELTEQHNIICNAMKHK